MIKMSEFFRNKRRTATVICVLCAVILGGILYINNLVKIYSAADKEKSSVQSNAYNASALLKFKTAYIGDSSNVVNLLSSLPFADLRKEVSLKTDNKPYELSVKYDFSISGLSTEAIEATLRNNAIVIFALIDNVDKINFIPNPFSGELKCQYTRAQLQQSYVKDFREYARDVKTFETLLNSLSLKLSASPKTIDEAVSLSIKAQSKCYGPGELSTEGHIILDTEEKDGKIKVYTIASFGAFGFENGIFTTVSGSGAIPTIMTFSKNEEGEYSLQEYKEPLDGEGNQKSIKNMFPQRLWDKVLSEQKYYPDLVKQKEEQAKQYLLSIGRNAKVSKTYVERELPKINTAASNKLFAEFTKGDPELNNFPYWIGTKELLENGVRYIYSTSQSKTSDGYDMISFKKTKEDGTVVKEYQYKIVGNEPQLVDQNTISSTK